MSPQRRRFQVKAWQVDADRCVIERGDDTVRIKPKSMLVLLALAEAGGDVVSRETLFGTVWPNADVTDDVLTQSIAELRKAFGDSAKAPAFIETIPRKGFRLIPAVEAPGEQPAQTSVTASPAWRNSPAIPMMAVAVLAVLLGIVFLAPGAGSGNTPPTSVAVLPFADMSPDGDQEYFADGLTEELINELVKLEGLRVTGRTSSFFFKGRNEDLRDIGRQLNVTHVLEGSVRVSGETLRVTAQLIDVEDGYHLWSETFDRRQADIFRIQEEISGNVANALSIRLGVGEPARYAGSTSNVEAHNLVLRGNGLYKSGKSGGINESLAMFREATELDPQYAIAWERLASTYLFARLVYGMEYWNRVRPLAHDAIDRALNLAPDSSIVLQTAAYLQIVDGDFFAARAYFDRLATADIPIPLSRTGTYIDMIIKTGHIEEAIQLQRENLLVDPKRSENLMYLGHSLMASGRLQDALDVLERAYTEGEMTSGISIEGLVAALSLDDPGLLDTWFARAVESAGAGAGDVLQRLSELHGDRDRSLAYLSGVFDASANDDFLVGIFAAYYGDTQLALDAMRRSADFWMYWYPLFAEVRQTPGFTSLVSDIGLVRYWQAYGWSDFCGVEGTAITCR